MTKEEILVGNKLIAEFMGAKIEQDYCEIEGQQDGLGFYFKKECAPENVLRYSSIGLQYNKSIDWLLLAIEKIESLQYPYCKDAHSIEVASYRNTCEIYYNGYRSGTIIEYTGINRIDALYNAIVEFIKKYNEWQQLE